MCKFPYWVLPLLCLLTHHPSIATPSLTAFMAHKCKCNKDVHTLTFAHNELLDTEEPVQATQTNIIMHAGHDAQGHPSIHTMHTAYVDKELHDLTSIYGALDNNDQSQTQPYGDKNLVTPLEDDSSPSFDEHQIPEGMEGHNTVSHS